MFLSDKIRDRLPSVRQQKGAATVEFAFALIALFGFFAIYMVCVEIFLGQEQTMFAGFAASRTYSVRGAAPAIQTAVAIDKMAAVRLESNQLIITKTIPLPKGIDAFLTGGRGRYRITRRFKAVREQQIRDDNPFPY